MRLVAWMSESIPGQEIEPAAPQRRDATVVLAHLRYGFGPAPQPDLNTHEMVSPDRPRAFGPE